MELQVGGVCEAFTAVCALEGPLSRMSPLVLLQVGRLGEGLGADGAGMRPQTRVHLAVPPQAAGVLEGLSTLFTDVRPLTCVLPQVILVVGAPFEGERTVRALEGSNPCMNPLVDGEQ